MINQVLPRSCRGVRRGGRLTSCASARRRQRRYNAFTLIELVLVIGIIIVLCALVLSTVGYVRKKVARARAETEIAAIAAACESYKADNGVYPRDPTANTATDSLNARTMVDPANANAALYTAASLVLYRALSGDRNLDRTVTVDDQNYNIDGTALSPPLTQLPRSYFAFKANILSPSGGNGNVTALADPFGNAYGYSTANQYDPSTGFNPTLDLWSTAGGTTTGDIPKWIKNW